MDPETQTTNCAYPNVFSDVFAPTVQDRLPRPGSVADTVLDHTTKVPTFIDTVSKDLCLDGRMGAESRDAALGFISRSSTTALVASSSASLAALAIGIGASPVAAIGLGVAGLALLPPAAEWAVDKVGTFFGDLSARFRSYEDE